jgi:hypothetical protein
VWWCAFVISVLGRLREEKEEFEASLSHTARPVSKKR